MNNTVKRITMTAVFTALIFVFTFVVKIPTATGYVHIGDAAVYIAAGMLGWPYALLAAGLGGALSDLLGGYTAYILPTFIIKAALTVPFTSKNSKLLCARNAVATVIAAAISIVGYYLTYVVILAFSAEQPLGSVFTAVPWVSAMATVPDNLVQAVVGGVAYFIISAALDKADFKVLISK